MRKNLILTVCTDYGLDDISLFVDSYRRYVTDSDLHIIGGRFKSGLVDAVSRFGIKVSDISNEYPPINKAHLRLLRTFKSKRGIRKYYRLVFKTLSSTSDSPQSYEFEMEGLIALRHKHYLDFLKANSSYENVAILDARDIIFQSNIFEIECKSVEFGMEENTTIQKGAFNHKWLSTIAGAAHADKFIDSDVSCAGATFAPSESMGKYLAVMSTLLASKNIPLGPVDQGAHNYVRLMNLVVNSEDVPNRTRRVQNMQGQTSWCLKDGFIRNLDGEITPVIHQWDRHAELYSWAAEFASKN